MNKQKKKILVVDDDKKYLDKVVKYLKKIDHNLEIITAENADQGIEKALAERPDAIITDKDMPVDDNKSILKQGNEGNCLAKAVKHVYDVPIFGNTGGNEAEFDKDVIDIAVSKNVGKDHYMKMLEILVKSDNPREEFLKYKNKDKPIDEQALALDILVQGYNLARQVEVGVQPIPGIELPVPKKELVDNLLDLKDIGVKPSEVYEKICEIDPSLETDAYFRIFFAEIEHGKYDIDEKVTFYVEAKLKEVFTKRYKNGT